MTTQPPFEIPTGGGKIAPGLWYAVPRPNRSDGDQRHWPGRPSYRPSPDSRYRLDLAVDWMKDQGTSTVGSNYYLESLPHGYGTFEMDQPGGKQVYRRLFGHPTGRYFDSIIKFRTHFFWLMSGMQGSCACVLCSPDKAKNVGMSNEARLGNMTLGPKVFKVRLNPQPVPTC